MIPTVKGVFSAVEYICEERGRFVVSVSSDNNNRTPVIVYGNLFAEDSAVTQPKMEVVLALNAVELKEASLKLGNKVIVADSEKNEMVIEYLRNEGCIIGWSPDHYRNKGYKEYARVRNDENTSFIVLDRTQ